MRDSGYEKEPNHYYVEPRWCVDALLDVEELQGLAWDPACGGGNILQAVRDRKLNIIGSDIVDRGCGAVIRDFLTCPKIMVDTIISNPPFNIMEDFLIRALTMTTDRVILLGRLAFLEGQKRRKLLEETPLARVWVSSRRISMPPGEQGIQAKGGSIAFAWFVWDHKHSGSAKIGWI